MITDMERIGDQAEDIAEIASNREKEDVEKIKAYSTYGGGNY